VARRGDRLGGAVIWRRHASRSGQAVMPRTWPFGRSWQRGRCL